MCMGVQGDWSSLIPRPTHKLHSARGSGYEARIETPFLILQSQSYTAEPLIKDAPNKGWLQYLMTLITSHSNTQCVI